MRLIGIEGMTGEELFEELEDGGRFVMYSYCISIIILTFKQPTDIYYIPPGEGRVGRGLVFCLISFFFGWWGFPFGPIFTIWSLVENLTGGKDVTNEVMASLARASRDDDDY